MRQAFPRLGDNPEFAALRSVHAAREAANRADELARKREHARLAGKHLNAGTAPDGTVSDMREIQAAAVHHVGAVNLGEGE